MSPCLFTAAGGCRKHHMLLCVFTAHIS